MGKINKKVILTGCCGVFGIILFIIALVVPWFYYTTDAKNDALNSQCTVTFQMYWKKTDCSTSGDCTTCSSSDDWRKDCSDTNGDCGDLENAFDVAGAFVGIGFMVFIIAFLSAIVVNLLKKGPGIASKLTIGLFTLAAVLTLIAVIAYPSKFPHAWKKSAATCFDNNANSDPCEIFAGSTKYTDSALDTTYKVTWGSGGWGVAFAAVIVSLINAGVGVVCKR